MTTTLHVRQIAAEIKRAFIEGYNSYATPAVAYNDEESAWNESEAKKTCERILSYEPTNE